jgi:N-acetylglutamate synthase-like GNAT family acetyltransferase
VKTVVKIRPAKEHDLAAVAALSGQLGYPKTPEVLKPAYETVLDKEADQALFVAAAEDGKVIGWLYIYIPRDYLMFEGSAEISGLVVDGDYRSRGVGGQLLDVAEEWAQRQGCRTVRVRSNEIRKEAHEFYSRRGYCIWKKQINFSKTLAPKQEP